MRETVKQFLANGERRACEVSTDRFLQSREDETDTAAALRECRSEKVTDVAEDQLPRFDSPDGWKLSNLEVDGGRATARVLQKGGEYDGREIVVEMLKQGGDWKVDRLDGVEIDAGFRRKIDSVFRASMDSHQQEAPSGLTDAQWNRFVDCTVERWQAAVPNHLFAERFEGRLEPGTFDRETAGLTRVCVRLLRPEP